MDLVNVDRLYRSIIHVSDFQQYYNRVKIAMKFLLSLVVDTDRQWRSQKNVSG